MRQRARRLAHLLVGMTMASRPVTAALVILERVGASGPAAGPGPREDV